MSTKRRSGAWLIALISIFIVAGSLLTALLQGGYFESPEMTEPPPQTPLPTDTSPPQDPLAPSPTSTPSPTGTHTETACIPPAGWVAYTVQPGDTIEFLAQTTGSTVADILLGNCLDSTEITPGSVLYLASLPATATATPSPTATNTGTLPPTVTSISCGPPSGWVRYTVQPGDTLFGLSQRLGVSVSQLQLANCLGNSTVIQAGQSLWVPFIPASPSRTPTPSSTPTVSPTPSASPSMTTTPPASPTATSSPLPTQTLPPTATPTPTTMGYPPPPGVSPTPTGTGAPYP